MSENATPKIVSQFTEAGHQFEVRHEKAADGQFTGYCDGVRSIVADTPDACARGLLRKHVEGLPEGKLIDFAAATARQKS